jgi:hypothetical protein
MVSVQYSYVPAFLKLVRPVEACSFRHWTASIPPTEVVTPYVYPQQVEPSPFACSLALNTAYDKAYGSVWRGKRSAAMTVQFRMFASSSNGNDIILYYTMLYVLYYTGTTLL